MVLLWLKPMASSRRSAWPALQAGLILRQALGAMLIGFVQRLVMVVADLRAGPGDVGTLRPHRLADRYRSDRHAGGAGADEGSRRPRRAEPSRLGPDADDGGSRLLRVPLVVHAAAGELGPLLLVDVALGILAVGFGSLLADLEMTMMSSMALRPRRRRRCRTDSCLTRRSVRPPRSCWAICGGVPPRAGAAAAADRAHGPGRCGPLRRQVGRKSPGS